MSIIGSVIFSDWKCNLHNSSEGKLEQSENRCTVTNRKGQAAFFKRVSLLCRKVRVFWFAKGKLRRVYDETLDAAQELQRGDATLFKLEAIDFGRRISIEKEIEGSEAALLPNAVFDESGNFVIYATLLGIEVSISHESCVPVSLVSCIPGHVELLLN